MRRAFNGKDGVFGRFHAQMTVDCLVGILRSIGTDDDVHVASIINDFEQICQPLGHRHVGGQVSFGCVFLDKPAGGVLHVCTILFFGKGKEIP